jgi:uncharacterized delta-60 repeat protein
MRRIVVAGVVASFLGLGIASASGTAGALDPTFAGGTGVSVETGITALIAAVAVDDQERIVAVGYTPTGRWWVARYTAAGALDTSFAGGAGHVTMAHEREARAVAIDAAGRILVAGAIRWGTKPKNTQTDFGLVRLLPDGSPDTSFGTGGRVVTDFGNPGDSAYEILLPEDGRIVLAGVSGTTHAAFARYLSNGALDTSFGGGSGKKKHAVGTGNTTFVGGLAQDASSRYVTTVPGKVSDGTTQSHAIRLLANGNLDTSFGVRRLQTPHAATWKYLTTTDLLVQPDGKIALSGYGNTYDNHRDGIVLRLLDDGSPDASFATSGLFSSGIRPDLDTAMALDRDADGRLLVASNRTPSGGTATASVFRLDVSGALDPTFGVGGFSAPASHSGGGLGAYDGRVVAVSGTFVAGGVAFGHPMVAHWLVE